MTKCIYIGCTQRAFYNFKEETIPIYCSKKHVPLQHKNIMVNIVIHCLNCYKRASFNLPGLSPKYCGPCAKSINPNMVNIKSPKCIICGKRACFNKEGEINPLYCSKHIPNGEIMINVVDKRICKHKGCKTNASFNLPDLPPKYCKSHITNPNMINVKQIRYCQYDGCKTTASYGISADKKIVNSALATRCTTHKTSEMCDVVHVKCDEPTCELLPSYNVKGEKPKYCLAHIFGKPRESEMVNVSDNTCKTQGCFTIVKNATRRNYEGYCFKCYVFIYPERPISRNYKVKENAVVNYLVSLFPNFNWKKDQIIGKSRKRPDLFLDLGYQILIIEIDENKHKKYNTEQERIKLLCLDVQERPIILIRFNPDNYKQGSKNIGSCWINNKEGCVIRKNKQQEWRERLVMLASKVEYWLNPINIITHQLEEIKLYFDDVKEG
jgi:hypothetical protein